MGDSITAFWRLPKTNLGISGEITAQMLARFANQVIDHGYRAVVIMGGTNDLREQTAPIEAQVDNAIANIGQMAELADNANLTVVLCKIPPIQDEDGRVEAFNIALETFAQQHHYKLVDYYTPMAGHPEYFRDGIHPNNHGYFVMQKALTEVLPLNYLFNGGNSTITTP